MILHSPDSAYAKEMTKWEAQGSTMGPGLRPYVKRDFPMMMHKAGRLSGGGIGIIDTYIVDEKQHPRYVQSGFRDTPLEAIEAYEAEQLEFAKLAAERNFEVRRMGTHAQAEVATAEAAAGARHLPTIPETPIKPRRSQRSMK